MDKSISFIKSNNFPSTYQLNLSSSDSDSITDIPRDSLINVNDGVIKEDTTSVTYIIILCLALFFFWIYVSHLINNRSLFSWLFSFGKQIKPMPSIQTPHGTSEIDKEN